ncbi:type IV toxin-antitoxin system AbiEi family antitoxin domain-containing protein [Siphonobacter curvatus]|uniref:Transcriptional regulator, AbiEi antitoxin, Type IV TA system n=1 Tax=Siphonobacter curvatus TaxID=2094562 RepID=A0A2S7IJ84_9BACT|nr:hypothetical protein [Siphonobacter curvatus]PQA56336.1 hypothetical protein C5O19_18520 [Siphonobacter curvatus]
MNLIQRIRNLSSQPLTHQLLSSLLKSYKRPNDKIHELISAGIIEPVKKGLYLPSAKRSETRTEPFLLANHMLGPSYVSFDSALSYYGLIPEWVFEVSSATTKASRSFNTPTGAFSFTRMPLPYYSFGIRQVELGKNQHALIASPEKALFDKIVHTAGLKLRSKIAAGDYLIENLRIEEDQLQQLARKTMETWLTDSPKRESLAQVIKFIRHYD